ncbi:uncharacterized protein LOC142353634 isoform X3 [Convolutriloba macropyga]|uniref:uncharacterized protein LOC142353634 isoform X3 n=1 Tax=Convolutriloba macropyga TaxID=536237 RepID=UPI003F525012
MDQFNVDPGAEQNGKHPLEDSEATPQQTPEYLAEESLLSQKQDEAPRNPSPPRDVSELSELLPDKIGNTTFSKRAVLSTMMHIASLVHERSLAQDSCGDVTTNGDSGKNSETGPDEIEKTPKKGLGSDSTATVPKSFSGYSALTIKSVSFTAANLNFSPLKTAKYGFSPAHENGAEPESPYNTAMKNRPISLARMAGVSFSPVDFSAFPNFKAYTPGSSRRHNGSVSNQRAGNWSPEGSESGKQNGDESTNKNDCNDSETAASQDEEFVFCDRLEQEYCELVDMTIEKDVVLYIFSETLSELLQYILFATDLPRIQELTLSIFANSSCVSKVCLQIIQNEALLDMTLAIIHMSSDADVLREALRLLTNLLNFNNEHDDQNQTEDEEFTKEVVNKIICYDLESAITFIIQSSLNDSLISQTLEILSTLLHDFGAEIRYWFTNDFVGHLAKFCLFLVQKVEDEKFLQSSATFEPSVRSLNLVMKILYQLTRNQSSAMVVYSNYEKVSETLERLSYLLANLNFNWIVEYHQLVRHIIAISLVVIFAHEQETTQSAILLQYKSISKLVRAAYTLSFEHVNGNEELQSSWIVDECTQDLLSGLKVVSGIFVSEATQLINARPDLFSNFDIFEGIAEKIKEYPPPVINS